MKEFICPECNIALEEKDKSLKCSNCGLLIWKQKAGYSLSESDIDDLLNNGVTSEHSFKKTGGGEFKTTLVINNKQLDFGFNLKNVSKEQIIAGASAGRTSGNNNPDSESDPTDRSKINTINIRVHSESSGKCHLILSGLQKKLDINLNFGIVAAREAECYATITAVCFAKWVVKTPDKYSVSISMNNMEFSNYLLREMTPRNKEMQYTVGYLWAQLKSFKSWNATLNYKKAHKLEGSNLSEFPRGVFPWISPLIFEAETRGEGYIHIKLPHNPAVIQQFKACFPVATALEEMQIDEENVYVMSVPKYAEKPLKAWVAVVKNI